MQSFLARGLLTSLLLFSTTILYAAPVALFDEGHRQQFLAGADGELHLSQFAGVLKEGGFVLETTPEPLTGALLQRVDLLVISGAFQPLAREEVEAVAAFVEQGGGLVVMLHIAPPMKDLLHLLEVDFSNGTLRETSQVIDNNPLDFRVTDLESHPLTEGLEGFSIYGAWALRGTADFARELARTSNHGWVDLDRNQVLSMGDAAQPFAVLVAGEYGEGRFAVFGDDALFQNRFLDDDNRRLAANLAQWMRPE